MAEILDLNKNTPAKPSNEQVGQTKEEEELHRHAEHEAMEAAKRAGERMKKNEEGHDIFSNM